VSERAAGISSAARSDVQQRAAYAAFAPAALRRRRTLTQPNPTPAITITINQYNNVTSLGRALKLTSQSGCLPQGSARRRPRISFRHHALEWAPPGGQVQNRAAGCPVRVRRLQFELQNCRAGGSRRAVCIRSLDG
jgi:hypothetical protein